MGHRVNDDSRYLLAEVLSLILVRYAVAENVQASGNSSFKNHKRQEVFKSNIIAGKTNEQSHMYYTKSKQ